MLGYRKFGTAQKTQYGEFTIYAGDDIAGHNPITDFYYAYWSKLDRPTRADIKPSKLAKYLDHAVLMDLEKTVDGFNLIVRLIGTYVSSYYGEISGKDINAMSNKDAVQRIYLLAQKVLENKEALLTVTPGFDEKKQFLEACALYMPLYSDDDTIEKIMVAVDVSSMNKGL